MSSAIYDPARLKPEFSEGLSTVVEVELQGNVAFGQLVEMIYDHYKVPYRLIKADIEYFGRAGFGTLLLQLQGSSERNEHVIGYLNRNKIKNSIKGYA